MERLAWIEILDRHGDVARRHPVMAWPVKVGRAYTNDLLLDDPYVAAHHLEIGAAEDGGYRIRDLGSLNGTLIAAGRGKTDTTISADDIVRIGQTQLRIRPPDYAVAGELALPRKAWLRNWPAVITSVVFLLSAVCVFYWLDFAGDESLGSLLEAILANILLASVWTGFWVLVGRVHTGRANFIPHALNTCWGLGSSYLLIVVAGYMGFAFDAAGATHLTYGVLLAGICLWMYRHLRLVSRASRAWIGSIAVVATLGISGTFYLENSLSNLDNPENTSYQKTIGPQWMLMVQGVSEDAFIVHASNMKVDADDR